MSQFASAYLAAVVTVFAFVGVMLWELWKLR